MATREPEDVPVGTNEVIPQMSEQELYLAANAEKLRLIFYDILNHHVDVTQHSIPADIRGRIGGIVVCKETPPACKPGTYAWYSPVRCLDAPEDGWVGVPFWRLSLLHDVVTGAAQEDAKWRLDGSIHALQKSFVYDDWDTILTLLRKMLVRGKVYLYVTVHLTDERTEVQWHMRVPEHPSGYLPIMPPTAEQYAGTYR